MRGEAPYPNPSPGSANRSQTNPLSAITVPTKDYKAAVNQSVALQSAVEQLEQSRLVNIQQAHRERTEYAIFLLQQRFPQQPTWVATAIKQLRAADQFITEVQL